MDHGPKDRDDQINSDIDAMLELQQEKEIWEEKLRARHKEPTETLWQLYLDTKKVRAGSTALFGFDAHEPMRSSHWGRTRGDGDRARNSSHPILLLDVHLLSSPMPQAMPDILLSISMSI